jgi:hypothetical protein
VKQGCPIAPLCFNVSVQAAIYEAAIASGDGDAAGVAYSDDFTIVGKPAAAVAAFRQLCTVTRANGLLLRPEKCAVFWPWSAAAPQDVKDLAAELGIATVVCRTMPFLGGVISIGDDAGVRRWAMERADASRPLLEDVLNDDVPVQVAMNMIRSCVLPRMAARARIVRPSLATAALSHFDALLLTAAKNELLIREEEVTESRSAQLQAPLRHAGLGLRPLVRIASAAYWASVASAVRDIRSFCTAEQWQRSSQFAALAECHARLIKDLRCGGGGAEEEKRRIAALLPSACTAEAVMAQFADGCPARYQNSLTLAAELGSAKAMATTPADARRIRCASGKGASLWLTALPLDPQLTMSDVDFRMAVRNRLGLHRARGLPAHCPMQKCGGELTPAHFHSCKAMRHSLVKHRHDAMVDSVVRVSRLAGVSTYKEAPLRDAQGKRTRPDATLLIPGDSVHIDLSCACPEAPSYAQITTDKVIRYRENAKHRKYDAMAEADGGRFLPVVVDTHGQFGDGARELFKLLEQEHTANTLTPDPLFRYRLMRTLSVRLQCANARLELEAIARLPRSAVRHGSLRMPPLPPRPPIPPDDDGPGEEKRSGSSAPAAATAAAAAAVTLSAVPSSAAAAAAGDAMATSALHFNPLIMHSSAAIAPVAAAAAAAAAVPIAPTVAATPATPSPLKNRRNTRTKALLKSHLTSSRTLFTAPSLAVTDAGLPPSDAAAVPRSSSSSSSSSSSTAAVAPSLSSR